MGVHVHVLHDSGEVGTRPRTASHRFDSIDFLRGLIMIVMALDHVRDYFSSAQFDPTDFSQTTGAYFLTRWITHFCAPVFSLLTGVGAYLWYSRGRTKAELSRFLVTRGLWLVFLELTVTRCLGWTFNFNYQMTLAGVLWILGWSMIVLAGAVWLPSRLFLSVALITIAGHDALRRVGPDSFGQYGWLWKMLHSPGNIEVTPGHNFFTAYVLIPWFAVMMAGFSLGRVFEWDAARRRTFLLRAGRGALALFIALRAINAYGDPQQWSTQKTAWFTIFSFLNATKYSPSLDYLLMTLGPALILLGLTNGADFSKWRFVVTFGRVPLFYYMLHIPLMHLTAVALCAWMTGDAHLLFVSHSIADFPAAKPPGWGFGLGGVYLVWALLIAALYPLCRWFAELKQKNRSPWLSYL